MLAVITTPSSDRALDKHRNFWLRRKINQMILGQLWSANGALQSGHLSQWQLTKLANHLHSRMAKLLAPSTRNSFLEMPCFRKVPSVKILATLDGDFVETRHNLKSASAEKGLLASGFVTWRRNARKLAVKARAKIWKLAFWSFHNAD